MTTPVLKRTTWDAVIAAAIAVLLFGAVSAVTGRITRAGGAGFDGEFYVEMVRNGWRADGSSTQLRPLFVLLTEFVDYFTWRDPVATFNALNAVYAAALGFVLALLLRHAGVERLAMQAFVANVFSTIAAVKVFAFAPAFIDLGAYLVLTIAIYLIYTERRVAAAMACILAGLSREFGILAALYGMARDIRFRRRFRNTVLTYTPAVAAYVALRWAVRPAFHTPDGVRLSTLDVFRLQTELWDHWSFWLFAGYFLVTVFGGITMLLTVRGGQVLRALWREYELAIIAVPLIAISLFGPDLWRFFAYLLPVVALLYAHVAKAPSRATLILMTVGTVLTQRPWQYMTEERYFRDWFPCVVVCADPGSADAAFWTAWAPRLVAAGAVMLVLAIIFRTSRSHTADIAAPETPALGTAS